MRNRNSALGQKTPEKWTRGEIIAVGIVVLLGIIMLGSLVSSFISALTGNMFQCYIWLGVSFGIAFILLHITRGEDE